MTNEELAGVDDLKERLRRIVKKPYSAKRGPPPCELQMLDRIAALEAKLAEKDAQLAEAREENERLLARLAHAEDDCEDDCIYCEERRQEIARAKENSRGTD